MSIFMLTPKTEEKAIVVDPTTNSEASVEKDAEQGGTVVPGEGYMAQKDIDESTIVIDGPLSQVYTQALNQAYAKESNTTEIESLIVASNEANARLENGKLTSYVYVIGGKELDENGLVDAFDNFSLAAESFKGDNLYICIEHGYVITPRIATLLSYARSVGATVLNNRVHALEFLGSKLKGK